MTNTEKAILTNQAAILSALSTIMDQQNINRSVAVVLARQAENTLAFVLAEEKRTPDV